MPQTFRNDDSVLRARVQKVVEERRALGLEGLVGGLETVLVTVESERLESAAADFLNTTGYKFETALSYGPDRACVLTHPGSADFLFRTRTSGPKPFADEPLGPKSTHLPGTRVEAMVFLCRDLRRYVDIQKKRGVRFLSDDIIRSDSWLFIQTAPSAYSALSFGFVQWLGEPRRHVSNLSPKADWTLPKPDAPHLKNIGVFDHASVRVRAKDRDDAIVEFLELTGYEFSMAVYVDNLNSITNVARLANEPYAMVITSGLGEAAAGQEGPTEMFIKNYGRRIHHLAFRTERIEDTFAGLKAQGMEFLLELVGSKEEGLKQTFSRPSKETLIVNEYIHRYEGFDGFFTKSNVTLLTEATAKQ
ncbi:MAG TPA: hypothetical protein VN419_00320 [Humidesulfovibrio sp.]|uniref:hypothetical protein n=1 Tax=Humidesulfovibrio sp. TaxID=2910988 RepID=UPI002C8D521E|nr:hypothetical protein [Humidesulfovibrio sp.]HWR02431.1 hypothetical protein [Humidesulfovibrio sp.]